MGDDPLWNAQVAQLSGFVSADTAYHHGETSLQSTIIGLAHNFIGSNNVNVLVPAGEALPHNMTISTMQVLCLNLAGLLTLNLWDGCKLQLPHCTCAGWCQQTSLDSDHPQMSQSIHGYRHVSAEHHRISWDLSARAAVQGNSAQGCREGRMLRGPGIS